MLAFGPAGRTTLTVRVAVAPNAGSARTFLLGHLRGAQVTLVPLGDASGSDAAFGDDAAGTHASVNSDAPPTPASMTTHPPCVVARWPPHRPVRR